MKLSELMKDVTPSPEFEGVVTAGDYVLAVDFSGTAADPGEYIVADGGVTEQSGALEATTAESTYLRSGTTETKTGTKRTFSIAGDRMAADEFQEALLDHNHSKGNRTEYARQEEKGHGRNDEPGAQPVSGSHRGTDRSESNDTAGSCPDRQR